LLPEVRLQVEWKGKMKPPYHVPTMKEIAELPWNGYKAISTFSGCGGSSLGYKMAGFKVLWANEFVPAAQDTYKANHPGTILDTRDIRQITAGQVLDAIGMQPGELDLLDGSPPCAAFSMSGKRNAGWGTVKHYSDTEQRVDDLFFEFTRLLNGIQPKVFVAENVAGLVKGVAKGYFLEILAAMKACGYKVAARQLSAQWLGVPQKRERIIYIGVRDDLKLEPVHPKPMTYDYSFGDAIGYDGELPGMAWFFPAESQTGRFWRWLVQTGEKDFTKAAKAILGRETMIQHRRCVYTEPVNTVVQGSKCLYHPSLPRTLSIPELKRVSSFPDDFVLTGSFDQQWERIGRAVPPMMMYEIAKTVRDEILCKL
jgi:DNA (cytosine-5)-methyltransferase 1